MQMELGHQQKSNVQMPEQKWMQCQINPIVAFASAGSSRICSNSAVAIIHLLIAAPFLEIHRHPIHLELCFLENYHPHLNFSFCSCLTQQCPRSLKTQAFDEKRIGPSTGSIRKQNGSKKEQKKKKILITLLKLLLTFFNFFSNLIFSEI